MDFIIATLQWGRGHVTADRKLLEWVIRQMDKLQWGRGHVTADSGGPLFGRRH